MKVACSCSPAFNNTDESEFVVATCYNNNKSSQNTTTGSATSSFGRCGADTTIEEVEVIHTPKSKNGKQKKTQKGKGGKKNNYDGIESILTDGEEEEDVDDDRNNLLQETPRAVVPKKPTVKKEQEIDHRKPTPLKKSRAHETFDTDESFTDGSESMTTNTDTFSRRRLVLHKTDSNEDSTISGDTDPASRYGKKENDESDKWALKQSASRMKLMMSAVRRKVVFRKAVEKELDYDVEPSQLYVCLQRRDWVGALARLDSYPEEAGYWIVRKSMTGKIQWKILPIHGAIIFSAPANVIDALLEAFPGAAACKDDQGKLPIHLSYHMACSAVASIETLKMAYPECMEVIDRKGRTPLMMAGENASLIGGNQEALQTIKEMKIQHQRELSTMKDNFEKSRTKLEQIIARLTLKLDEVENAKSEIVMSVSDEEQPILEAVKEDEENKNDEKPKVKKAVAKKLETKKSETKKPETKKVETKKPETKKPETKKLETKKEESDLNSECQRKLEQELEKELLSLHRENKKLKSILVAKKRETSTNGQRPTKSGRASSHHPWAFGVGRVSAKAV